MQRPTLTLAVAGATAIASVPAARAGRSAVGRTILWSTAALATLVAGNELLGKPLPFLRWHTLRLLASQKRFYREWQVGDGREDAFADYVVEHAAHGDVDDAIRAADEFAVRKKLLVNVGDEKGAILDEAVRRARPRRLLELGTYCGYSALRMARVMPPDGHIWSIELNPANAAVARRIWRHAGVDDRITVLVGVLGDDGRTLTTLYEQHGFTPGSLDLVFIDHAKAEYVADLERLLTQQWLHPGSVVVADNILVPGAPDYLKYMREHEGVDWHTIEHRAHVEYQALLRDLVLESRFLGTGQTA